MKAGDVKIGGLLDGGTVCHKIDFTVADHLYVGFEVEADGQVWSVLYPADKEL